MEGDGLLTDWFEQVHGRFGTPHRALLITGGGIVALMILDITIGVLAEVASFMFLVTYGLVHVAVIRLRRNDDEYDSEFRIPDMLYPIVVVLGVLAILAIVSQMNAIVIARGLVLIVAGAAWYLLSIRYLSE